MEEFSIALVQMNALKGDLEHNLSIHAEFSKKAARRKCRMVVFPELSVTAHYGDPKVTEFAEEAGRGRIHDFIKELAAELGLVIGYGYCELAHGSLYNSFSLMGPGGLIGTQRKTHASLDEYFSFRMGRTLEVFDLGFCRVGVLICFDSCFFEAWRVLALKGADVILAPHASRSGLGKKIPLPQQKRQLADLVPDSMTRLRIFSADNAVFSVFANQVGYNGHSTHWGGAYVLDPAGKALARSPLRTDNLMVVATLNPKFLFEARNNRFALMRTRRPEIYKEVVEMI